MIIIKLQPQVNIRELMLININLQQIRQTVFVFCYVPFLFMGKLKRDVTEYPNSTVEWGISVKRIPRGDSRFNRSIVMELLACSEYSWRS